MPTVTTVTTVTASDGTRLAVETGEPAGGAGSPVTLVLVHGWTQDRRTWDRVVGELASPVRTVRYDLRGHGDSEPAGPESATIDRLADDLAEVIATQAPSGPVVLAGHSMGGMTIMALADRHPDLVARRVAGAAFVATSSGNMDHLTLGFPGALGRGAARLERRLAKLLVAYRRDRLPVAGPFAALGSRLLVFGKRPRKADVRSVADQLRKADPRSLGGFQNAISLHDRAAALSALAAVPTVVLAGDRDRLIPVEHAEAIAEQLPDARFVVFPGAGHMITQERCTGVAEAIGVLVTGAVADAAAAGNGSGEPAGATADGAAESPHRSRATPAST
ncbi:alpha/beta hydrolase [Prauserella halophila]|uniref:Alpha/beta hydrolase n=1 Tax=Prauserella halophila TaxID=185641 RepID=A0ABN1WGJ9_9PSEU|nr:alpha/beta hydrolase [Prauserella halophila]